ncbi:MAG: nucleoside monophosphate kinase [Candidatus Pacebacteria bacterium]|nr:nucleoside monophosphate kinase [Candidatus Paceibacterota bacterium]MBP9839643.1 nucleoside monophosphate kinase [Candidatus Paceibacterota bacterium]MDQ5922460.1 adenylate kinase [Patescibacteria group bacterium]
MKKLGFNIVLLGMIASGKDTQAEILKSKYALKSVETGTYTRKLMKEKSKNGDWARRTAGKGKPLPTALLQKFLIEEIKNKPKNKNLLFLGGRLKPEAQLLKKLMDQRKEEILVFYITLPDKEVYKRSLIRQRNVDDKKYVAKRIKWHKDQVGKTVNYYKKLKIIKIINGNQTIPKVTKDILMYIKNKDPRQNGDLK